MRTTNIMIFTRITVVVNIYCQDQNTGKKHDLKWLGDKKNYMKFYIILKNLQHDTDTDIDIG